MTHCVAFEELKPYLEQKRRYSHTLAVLYYDIATLCPEKGIADEAGLLDYWDAEATKTFQDPSFIKIVKAGLADPNASLMEKRLFGTLYEQVILMEKLSISDYLDYKTAISKSNEMWRKFRPDNNFEGWLPYWQRLVDVSRKVADVRHKNGQKTRYDACLDSYEPGESEAYLDSVFSPLKDELIALIRKAKEKQRHYAMPPLKPYSIDKQEKLGRKMLETIRYDMKGGCLMVSAHPFSNDNRQFDARLTTKYLVDDWRSNVFTCLHEGGHCLEFQNKPQEMYDHYVESTATAAICETHSRFYENIIGRSREFMPLMRKACAETLDPAFATMSDEDFFHLINSVRPWLIRCEADEVSYCLHIIIRYEIEKDLINGKIECRDVPALWKKKYKDYLGVDVPNDRDGCMQDTHWSEALWGYFPSYALGNLYGAMIKEKMETEIPFSKCIEENDFQTILKWFAENDFRYDWMEPGDWIKKITGKSLTAEPYIRYLNKKFE